MSMFEKVMLDPKQGWLPEYFGCQSCPFYKKMTNTYMAYHTCKNCNGKTVDTKQLRID